MTRTKLLWLMLGALILTSLSPLTAEAKKKVDLSTYFYATSYTDDLRYRKDWNFRNAEATVLEGIGKTRLDLIEPSEISKMTTIQKQALLLVRFNVQQREDGGNVTVDLLDFNSKKPVITYRGSYYTALGGAGGDLETAIEKILKKIDKDFPPTAPAADAK